MTMEQLIQKLVLSHAVLAQTHDVIVDVDVESSSQPLSRADLLFDILNNVLVHAIESSPKRSRVSISTIETTMGIEIEIADSSDLTSDSAWSSSFVVEKSERDLRRMGGQFCVLNCPQGGVAYSIAIPNSVRAVA